MLSENVFSHLGYRDFHLRYNNNNNKKNNNNNNNKNNNNSNNHIKHGVLTECVPLTNGFDSTDVREQNMWLASF